MNIRTPAIIFVFAAAPAIAFPLGVRVGSGWGAKIGPESFDSQNGRPIAAHTQPVRVIMSNTLDGQPIPGAEPQAPGPSRALSPVYPTSPSAEMSLSVSQGLAPAFQRNDSEPARPEAEAAAGDSAPASPAISDPSPKAQAGATDPPQASPPGSEAPSRAGEPDGRFSKHKGIVGAFARHPWRRYSWHHGRYRYFAHRHGRRSDPFTSFARLFFR